MVKLSAVLIVKNEAANLPRCLASIAWVDEIVVCDTGSTDDTIRICEELGCKVHQIEWEGFGKAKKKAVSLAQNEWILSIDADEELSPALQKEIRALAGRDFKKKAWRIKRRSFYLGKPIFFCGWQKDAPLRIFNKRFGNFNEALVHESVRTVQDRRTLMGIMYHHTYPTLQSHFEKMRLYAALGAEKAQGRLSSPKQAINHALAKFFTMYFLKLGFLDGWKGFLLCKNSSWGVWYKYYLLWKKQSREEQEPDLTRQIKVLHVDTEKGWRGGQQQALYIFEAMHRQGFQTEFICPPHSKMENRLVERKLPHHTIRYRGEWDFASGLKLAIYAMRHGFRILHLHSGHALSQGLWAKLFYRELILVASRRVDFSIKKNPLSAYKYKNDWLDRIIAISDNIRQVLLSDGIPDSQISVIHSGIDLMRFEKVSPDPRFRSHWQIPEDAILVGTVAAFAGHKDYPNFLEAAARALKEDPRLWFMAVGDGKLLDRMKELASLLKLSDRFTFAGFHSEIGTFLKAFDIFVLSSRKEGLGTSMLDALSLGKAVVGTRAGGIPEMIEDGKNGLLVPTRDAESLARAILGLANDSELRRKLSEAAIPSIRDFSIERTVDKHLTLYRELLEASQSHPQSRQDAFHPKEKSYKRILLIQTAFLGDVILSTPLPRALKQLYPEATIDLLLIPQTQIVYHNNPHVNRIYLFDKRKLKNKIISFPGLIKDLKANAYDLSISLHVSQTSSWIPVLAGIPKRLGFPRQKFTTLSIPLTKGIPVVKRSLLLLSALSDMSFDHQTELFPDAESLSQAKEFVKKTGLDSSRLIALAPGSIWPTKCWPEEHYASLIKMLSDEGYGSILIGSAEDRALCERIIQSSQAANAFNAAGEFKLLGSAALIAETQLLICNDSSPLHLANAMQVPVLAFFGPTVKRFGFFPYRPGDRVLEIELYCRPCGKHGGKSCPQDHFRCLKDILPQDALQACLEMLKR